MNRIVRSLAGAGFGLAFAAGTIATAAPAHAVGEGCYGVPDVPAATVCVVQATPENAVPDVGTGTTQVVAIPSVCSPAGCTFETPIFAPVVVVEPEDEPVVVVSYGGRTYTIGTAGAGGDELGTDVLDPLADYALAWARIVVGVVDELDPDLDCHDVEKALHRALRRPVHIRHC